MSNIYLSLTTIPSRINKIGKTINSLQLFGYKIILNIPYFCVKENLHYNIPDWINNNSNLIINRCNDYGPFTKLIPTLDFVNDDDIIIICDDDMKYRSNWANNLIDNITANDNTIICYTSFTHTDITIDNNKLQIMEAYKGIALKKKYINKDKILNLLYQSKSCFYSDDLILSYYIYNQNIKVITLPKKKYSHKELFFDYKDYNLPELSLREGKITGGNMNNYKNAIELLKNNKLLIINKITKTFNIDKILTISNDKNLSLIKNISMNLNNIENLNFSVFNEYKNHKVLLIDNISQYISTKLNENNLFKLVRIKNYDDSLKKKNNMLTDRNLIIRNCCELINLLKYFEYKYLILIEENDKNLSNFKNNYLLEEFLEFDHQVKVFEGLNIKIFLFEIKKNNILAITNSFKFYYINKTKKKMTDSYLYNYDALVRNYNNITSIDITYIMDHININYTEFKFVFITYFLDDTTWNKNLRGKMRRFNKLLTNIKKHSKIVIEISQDQQHLFQKDEFDTYKIDKLDINLNGLENLKYYCEMYNIRNIVVRYFNSIPMNYIKSKLNNITYYHVPLCLNSDYYKDYNQPKIYDIAYYGDFSSYSYPLRIRFTNIVSRLTNLKIKIKHISHIRDDELSCEINKSYICFASKSSIDYLVCKYFEISMSKCTILGNMATDGLNIWKDNYIHIDMDKTDDEIVDIIIDALKDKKKLLEKANLMYDVINNQYDINSNITRYNAIFEKILNN